jgi:hypothetical protein
MRPAFPRFTVCGTMIAIALLALFLGAFRAHSFGGIFVGCVVSATYARTRGAIERSRQRGRMVTFRQKGAVLGSSLLVSVLILGLGDLTFLTVYSVVASFTNRRMHQLPCLDSFSVVVGLIPAVLIASGLRLLLWPCETRDHPPETFDLIGHANGAGESIGPDPLGPVIEPPTKPLRER